MTDRGLRRSGRAAACSREDGFRIPRLANTMAVDVPGLEVTWQQGRWEEKRWVAASVKGRFFSMNFEGKSSGAHLLQRRKVDYRLLE